MSEFENPVTLTRLLPPALGSSVLSREQGAEARSIAVLVRGGPMQITEIYATNQVRHTSELSAVSLVPRDFAPPSAPMGASADRQ